MDGSIAEIVNRVIKYLIEGLLVAAAALLIPRKALPMDEVATLAVLAAVVFAILHGCYGTPGCLLRYRCQPRGLP